MSNVISYLRINIRKKPPVRMAEYRIGAGKETLTPGLFHGKEAL